MEEKWRNELLVMVTVGALLMDFFSPLGGISLFCDHGGVGSVWLGLVWFANWK